MAEPYIQFFTPDNPGPLKALGINPTTPIAIVVMDYNDFVDDLAMVRVPTHISIPAINQGHFFATYAEQSEPLYRKYNIPSDHLLGLQIRSAQIGEVTNVEHVAGTPSEEVQALNRVYENLPLAYREMVDGYSSQFSQGGHLQLLRDFNADLVKMSGYQKNAIWLRYLKSVQQSIETYRKMNPDVDRDLQLGYYRRLLGSTANMFLQFAPGHFKGLEELYEENQ